MWIQIFHVPSKKHSPLLTLFQQYRDILNFLLMWDKFTTLFYFWLENAIHLKFAQVLLVGGLNYKNISWSLHFFYVVWKFLNGNIVNHDASVYIYLQRSKVSRAESWWHKLCIYWLSVFKRFLCYCDSIWWWADQVVGYWKW